MQPVERITAERPKLLKRKAEAESDKKSQHRSRYVPKPPNANQKEK